MEWVFLEVFIALAIGIAIVWWTMAPNKKRDVNGAATKKADREGTGKG
ncbi:MAG: hypothetical protein ACR2HE_06000 [Casimicrobiaceae bacterium]